MSEMFADFEARRADSAEKKLTAMREQIPALERRIARLEARKGVTEGDLKKALLALAPLINKRIEESTEGLMRWKGVYQKALNYQRGDCVTHGGNLWFALRDMDSAAGAPGTDEGAALWAMMTKSK